MWVLLTCIAQILQQMSSRLHNLEIWEKPNISLKLELKQALNLEQLKLGFLSV